MRTKKPLTNNTAAGLWSGTALRFGEQECRAEARATFGWHVLRLGEGRVVRVVSSRRPSLEAPSVPPGDWFDVAQIPCGTRVASDAAKWR